MKKGLFGFVYYVLVAYRRFAQSLIRLISGAAWILSIPSDDRWNALSKPFRILLICGFLIPTPQAHGLICCSTSTPKGTSDFGYYNGTCKDAQTAADNAGIILNSCKNAITSQGPPGYSDIMQLMNGVDISGPLISIASSIVTNVSRFQIVVFVREVDGQMITQVARLGTNGVVEIADVSLPTIPDSGAIFAESIVKAGEVPVVPFQDPDPLKSPSSSDFTLTYASLTSNLTVIASQDVPIDLSLLTFTPSYQSYTIQVPNDFSYVAIANQFDHGSNTLDEILANVPAGTSLLKWDCSIQDWTTAQFFSGHWFPNETLAPGEGALIASGSGAGGTTTLTFTGSPRVPVLPATLPCGCGNKNLLSRQTVGIGTFENITGQSPQEGAQVRRWDVASQDDSLTYVFSGGVWTPSVPSVSVGESAFIVIPCATNPPVITQQPQTQIVPLGSNATFTVVATGTPPLSYQWHFNSVNIPGSTNATLALVNIATNDYGVYDVAVSNAAGSTNSEQAELRRGGCTSHCTVDLDNIGSTYVSCDSANALLATYHGCPGDLFMFDGHASGFADESCSDYFDSFPPELHYAQLSGVLTGLGISFDSGSTWLPFPGYMAGTVSVDLSEYGLPSFKIRGSFPTTALPGDTATIQLKTVGESFCTGCLQLTFIVDGNDLKVTSTHLTGCCFHFDLAPHCGTAPADIAKIVAQVTSSSGKVATAGPIGTTLAVIENPISVTWDSAVSGTAPLSFPNSLDLCFECGNTANIMVNFKGYRSDGSLAQLNETLTVNSAACKDTTPPTIDVCPGSLSGTDNTIPPVTVMVTAHDNCTPPGDLQITQSPVAGMPASIFHSTPITVTVKDAAGNFSICTVNYSITLKLEVARANDGFRVHWPPSSDHQVRLQEAGGLRGPWTNVLGATNPYSVLPTGPQRFFRLNVEE